MAQLVMVRTFTSEESDPRWAVRTGAPMQIRMGEEVGKLHLTEAKVERSGFTTFHGSMNQRPVQGFYGIREPGIGRARKLLSGFGMIMIHVFLIMIVPASMLLPVLDCCHIL